MSSEIPDEVSALLTESQPRIYGFIFKRVADHDQTKEILQETNLVICRKANEFQIGTNFIAWAFKIAHFQILANRQKANNAPILSDKTIDLFELREDEKNEIFSSRITALKSCLRSLSLTTTKNLSCNAILVNFLSRTMLVRWAKEKMP